MLAKTYHLIRTTTTVIIPAQMCVRLELADIISQSQNSTKPLMNLCSKKIDPQLESNRYQEKLSNINRVNLKIRA